MKNLKSIIVLVVIMVVIVSMVSSCTKEYQGPESRTLPSLISTNIVEFDVPYSVEEGQVLKVWLSGNEKYDRVTLRTGFNSFADPDGDYFTIQSDTLYLKVGPNCTVGKFELWYGDHTQVHVELQ